jgi:hypothetical protein
MDDSDFWQHLANDFRLIPNYDRMLRADGRGIVGSNEPWKWELKGSDANPWIYGAFKDRVSHGARELPQSGTHDLLIVWLEALRLGGYNFRSTSQASGTIDRVSEASASFCEDRALQIESKEKQVPESISSPDSISESEPVAQSASVGQDEEIERRRKLLAEYKAAEAAGGERKVERDQAPVERDQTPAAVNRFERQDEVWLISYDDETAIIPATHSGLEYIAMLLREPLRSIEAWRLEALSTAKDPLIQSTEAMDKEITADEFASPYERLDAKAIQQYKDRALVLREEIEDANERQQDSEKSHRLMSELQAIKDQLSADTGLGGRSRRFADDSEKARMRVTNAIKRALQKIATHAPKTADHLRFNIATGTSMIYRDAHTSWKF